MIHFRIMVAVTSGFSPLVAVLKKTISATKSFLKKVVVAPGRAYWAARLDALGDAALFSAMGSFAANLLGVGHDNIVIAVYLFLGAIAMFLTANWFRN